MEFDSLLINQNKPYTSNHFPPLKSARNVLNRQKHSSEEEIILRYLRYFRRHQTFRTPSSWSGIYEGAAVILNSTQERKIIYSVPASGAILEVKRRGKQCKLKKRFP